MSNKKSFLIALFLVSIAAALFAGLFIYNANIQKNNLKKVALEADFTSKDEFEIFIKSNDGSNFKLKSLPVKITINLEDGYSETFNEDIVKYRYGDPSYNKILPISRYEKGLMVSGRSQKIYDGIMIRGSRKNQPVKSVDLEYEGKKSSFNNKKLDEIKKKEEERKKREEEFFKNRGGGSYGYVYSD